MCASPFHLVFCQLDEDVYLPPRWLSSTRSWLGEHLGQPKAVDEGWAVYTSVEGHCIELICEDVDEWQLHVQVVAEHGTERFGRQVCALARALGCQLYSPEFETLIEPRLEAMQRLLLRSEAWDHALHCGAVVAPTHGALLSPWAAPRHG